MHPILVCWLLAILYIIPLSISLYQLKLPSLIIMLLFFAGLGGSFSVYYFQFYRPFIRKKGDFLNLLLPDIFCIIESKIVETRPQINNLRINVMIVKKKFFKPWEHYLEFLYWQEDYKKAEVEQKYPIHVGCCGTALFEKEQVFYDKKLYHETLAGMSQTQREITGHIGSVLSTPIFSPGDNWQRKPIAILNIDSTDDISVTGFNDNIIQEIAVNRAAVLGGLLI
jgi:hypothetical protein